MRVLATLLLLPFATLPCLAQDGGPAEVGTTTMKPGMYTVTEMASGKTSYLTITTKGNMILQEAPAAAAPAAVAPAAVAPAAVAPAAVAPAAVAPAAVAPAAVAPAAVAPAAVAPAAVAPAAVAPAAPAQPSAIQGLMSKTMQKGVSELMKRGGQQQVDKLLNSAKKAF